MVSFAPQCCARQAVRCPLRPRANSARFGQRWHGSEQLRSGSSSSLASIGLRGHSCQLRPQSYSNRRHIFHQKACFAVLRINA